MANKMNLLLVLAVAASSLFPLAAAQATCYAEWSISNTYTVASVKTSYVTLNLYLSTKGPVDIVAPYNLTIHNPAYKGAFSWNIKVVDTIDGTIFATSVPSYSYWETLLADGKNIVNVGGNIETTVLGAGPEAITIAGIKCELVEASPYTPPPIAPTPGVEAPAPTATP